MKQTVREVESEEACLIFDDTIQEKNEFIEKKKKKFIAAIKSNRLFATNYILFLVKSSKILEAISFTSFATRLTSLTVVELC